MSSELWKLPALILLVISLSLLLSFTSSVDLSRTGFSGFIGGDHEKVEDIPQKTVPVFYEESNMEDLNQESDPPQVPVFFVEGLNRNTNHLRLYTASTYQEGTWTEDEVDYSDRKAISGTTITRYTVTPLISFSRHIPVARDTFFVTAPAKYSAQTGTYLVDNLSTGYSGYSSSQDLKAEKVDSNAEIGTVDIYGRNRIRELTLNITSQAENDYQKVVLIKQYLEDNYRYDTQHWSSPHPVYSFLFEQKKGVCKHFASVFVIMCRTIDLPARGVFGYLAQPVSYNQTVLASQAHMWAEIKFEEGWMEFDPTPPPEEKIPTVTEIDYIDKTARRGSSFTVSGTVNSKEGTPSGYVEIYLNKDKDKEGLLVDILQLKEGTFRSNVSVPDVSGDYHVMAHYVGSMRYQGSWSDPIIKIYSPANLEADIPNMTARECHISGSLYDYNGTPLRNATVKLQIVEPSPTQQNGSDKDIDLLVEVEDVYRTQTSADGSFQFDIHFREKGTRIVEVSYPGDEYILPVSVRKKVEVGDVHLMVNDTTAVRGKVWNSTGRLLFNDRPLESLIIFENLTSTMAQDGKFNITTRVPSSFPLGTSQLKYTVSDLNYLSTINFTVKAESHLNVDVKKDKNWIVFVYLKDDRGNPISGELEIANHTIYTSEGVAKVESSELPLKFEVIFPGNERYMGSSTTVDRSSFPYWVFALLIPVAAFVAYKMRAKELIVLDWGSDLPPIWDVGEEISIKVRLKDSGEGVLRASLDGEGLDVGDSLDLNFNFREQGKYHLVAERLVKGKVKERKHLEIEIMSYSQAIIQTFGELVRTAEEKKNMQLKDATAREVLKAIGIDDGKVLLDLFEYAKYGEDEFTRNDFSTAYHAYLNISRGIV